MLVFNFADSPHKGGAEMQREGLESHAGAIGISR
jgi:hypothetical protein